MLYTRKGDKGMTDVFCLKSRRKISKGSSQIELLGTLDELNSFLGMLKVKSAEVSWTLGNHSKNADTDRPVTIIHWVQNRLFVIQAEIAGADKHIDLACTKKLETMIDTIEEILPPIKTFYVSGGTELATMFDIARALVRRAERRAVTALEARDIKICESTLIFLNRLSSLFYAMARLVNHRSGITEESPEYE